MADQEPTAEPPTVRGPDPFPQTLWTLIVNATDGAAHADFEANWRRLVELYRAPIEATLRRSLRWFPHLSVEDAAGELFSYLYERDVLRSVDRSKGRFRQFLQGVIRNFVLTRLARADGGRTVSTERSGLEVVAPDTTRAIEIEEERGWMQGLLHDALLRCQQKHPDWAMVFARRHGLALAGESPADAIELSAAELAAQLQRTVGAIHVARHRALTFVRAAVQRRIGEACLDFGDYAEELRVFESRVEEQNPGVMGEALAG